jgi:hypothetical protein
MLALQYSSHTTLADGTVLLSVLETTSERRWFRTVERSRGIAYAFRSGFWWGEHNERVTDNAKVLRLCELVLQADLRASVDAAVGF